jgi:hypothetical protein
MEYYLNKHLAHTSLYYSNLIGEMVSRVNGVFIWVFFVVQELLVGLTYHETLSTMRRRLDAFPQDHERYFQRLINVVLAFD